MYEYLKEHSGAFRRHEVRTLVGAFNKAAPDCLHNVAALAVTAVTICHFVSGSRSRICNQVSSPQRWESTPSIWIHDRRLITGSAGLPIRSGITLGEVGCIGLGVGRI